LEPDPDNAGEGKRPFTYFNHADSPVKIVNAVRPCWQTAFFICGRASVKITVNGTPEETLPCSLRAFILGKGLTVEAVVVEYNYRIVKKNDWDGIELMENDNLEILSFVGGG
jgi:sulfur carrier protein